MADKVITSTGDCSACCEPPADCSCALLIPIAGTPMGATVTPCADYATAAALVASIQVASCLGYCEYDGSSVFTSFTTDDSVADELTLEAVGNPQGSAQCQALMWCGLSALSGSTISVDSSAGGGLADGGSTLYSCDGALVSSESEATQTHSVPSDGTYYLLCDVTSNTSGASGGSDTLTAVVSCDMAIVFNPVIALWDDSGTTRKLWACPKLLLPPLTEASGDWYADCAEALADITDYSTSCLVYVTPNADSVGTTMITFPPPPTFAFTPSASNNAIGSAPPVPTLDAYAGLNLVSGDTLNVAWDYSAYISVLAAWVVTVSLYDDAGVIVGSPQTDSSNTSGSFNFSVPYTGRFTLRFQVVGESTGPGPGGEYTSYSISDFSITCSGDFTANPIQALYDIGLTCPARLACGDACP